MTLQRRLDELEARSNSVGHRRVCVRFVDETVETACEREHVQPGEDVSWIEFEEVSI